MTNEDTKTPAQILPEVLARLPGQSKGVSESLKPPDLEPPKSSAVVNSKNCHPLRTEWQRRRFNLNSAAPGVQAMVDACERWCRSVAKNSREGRAIVLSGPFGCGKTHALDSSTRYVRDIRMAVWPEPWPKPLQFMSVNWAYVIREIADNDNREYGDDLLASDVIFLDDIGSEEDRFKSGAATRILGDFLGQMHKDRKFIFITTNIAPWGWKERWDGRVEDRLLRIEADIVNLWDKNSESYSSWKAKQ